MQKRQFIKKAMGRAIATTLHALDTTVSSEEHHENIVEIKPVYLTLPRLHPAFHGYRIAHLSDLHMDSDEMMHYLYNAMMLVQQQHPDMVVITGDFSSRKAERNAEKMVMVLRQLTPPDGTLAVMGNHDHYPWNNPAIIRWVLKESGIRLLDNKIHTLTREPNAMLHICGVDDMLEQHDRLDVVVNHLPREGAAVLLCHAPDFADTSAETKRFDVQLSGHSHGGQLAFPVLGPQMLPRYGRKYANGLYNVKGMLQYTNRGLAYPLMRFHCRPEITIITLQAKKQRA